MSDPTNPAWNPADASDEDLVERATRGESSALKELLCRQQTWIYNLF
jgi:hypothetical protein